MAALRGAEAGRRPRPRSCVEQGQASGLSALCVWPRRGCWSWVASGAHVHMALCHGAREGCEAPFLVPTRPHPGASKQNLLPWPQGCAQGGCPNYHKMINNTHHFMVLGLRGQRSLSGLRPGCRLALLSAGSGVEPFPAHPGVHSMCCGTEIPILCCCHLGPLTPPGLSQDSEPAAGAQIYLSDPTLSSHLFLWS